MLKRVVVWMCALCACIGIARFCHEKTDGFRLTKISNNTFEGAPSLGMELFEREIFAEPFTNLARGKQSFVFVSQDGKLVLKLLNNHYQKRIHLLSKLPGQKERISYFQKKLRACKESYLLAFSEMREETGLLFLHLSETENLCQKVGVIDKLGITHEIDLDKTAFILQRRGRLVHPQLLSWIEGGDLAAAKQGIRSLVKLLKIRLGKGIQDKDPLIRTNIGFIDGRAHFLDLGPFSKNSTPKTPEEERGEIQKITHSLKLWLQERAPSLAPFLDEECAKEL